MKSETKSQLNDIYQLAETMHMIETADETSTYIDNTSRTQFLEEAGNLLSKLLTTFKSKE